MRSKKSETVHYGVVIRGGVEIFTEVNKVGRYVVIANNFPESVVEVEVEVVDVGVEAENGDQGEDVVGGSVVG